VEQNPPAIFHLGRRIVPGPQAVVAAVAPGVGIERHWPAAYGVVVRVDHPPRRRTRVTLYSQIAHPRRRQRALRFRLRLPPLASNLLAIVVDLQRAGVAARAASLGPVSQYLNRAMLLQHLDIATHLPPPVARATLDVRFPTFGRCAEANFHPRSDEE